MGSKNSVRKQSEGYYFNATMNPIVRVGVNKTSVVDLWAIYQNYGPIKRILHKNSIDSRKKPESYTPNTKEAIEERLVRAALAAKYCHVIQFICF